MQQITIKTYRAGFEIDKPHFFILNKGKNSGKPSREPWTNSFVAYSDDAIVVDYYYWLCFCLWQTKAFEYYLRGSVIEFIIVKDVYTLLKKYVEAFAQKHIEFNKLLTTLKAMNDYETNVKANLNTINKARKHLLHQYLKGN
jgi:hypothetical protein